MNQTHPSQSARRAPRALCAAAILATLGLLAAPALAAGGPEQTAMAEPGAAPEAVMGQMPAAAATAAPERALSPAVAAGLNAYNTGDYTAAAERLQQAAATDPADAAAPYFLGYAYYRMGEFAKARAAFARAYRTDPDYSPEPPAAR